MIKPKVVSVKNHFQEINVKLVSVIVQKIKNLAMEKEDVIL